MSVNLQQEENEIKDLMGERFQSLFTGMGKKIDLIFPAWTGLLSFAPYIISLRKK